MDDGWASEVIRRDVEVTNNFLNYLPVESRVEESPDPNSLSYFETGPDALSVPSPGPGGLGSRRRGKGPDRSRVPRSVL